MIIESVRVMQLIDALPKIELVINVNGERIYFDSIQHYKTVEAAQEVVRKIKE